MTACLSVVPLSGQAPQTQKVPVAATISLAVVDPSGAKVVGAQVRFFLRDSTDGVPVQTAHTDRNGQLSIALPAGRYMAEIQSPGFVTVQQPFEPRKTGEPVLVVKLHIATTNENITVSGDEAEGSGAANGVALVLRGNQLNALASDPSTLQQQLNALVGTDDGSPPQLRIDGFTGGRLPPKSSIREIRINQNVYSAQFDQRGNSVLDIFTKPGTDKLHGSFYMSGNADPLNAPNRFIRVASQPGYHTTYFDGNVNGPMFRNTSFFAGVSRNSLQNNAAVNAFVLDPSLNVVPFSQAVSNPSVTNFFNARIDRQFGQKNTFTARVSFSNSRQTNAGVGQLVLASQGYTSETKNTTLQLGNTTLASPHVVVETRFQYRRDRSSQTPVSSATTLTVQGSFNGGGSDAQVFRDAQDNYEWQEYLSIDRGKHFLRVGARYRLTRDSNSSTAGYNGQYVFPSLSAYQMTLRGLAAGQTQAQIRAAGGGPSQYSVTMGTPSAIISTGDLGFYFEDEWKVRPTFSLTSGLRYESQYGRPDHNDPAPRVGFSWQITRGRAKIPVVRLRGGMGMFYDRFPASNLLIAARQDGVLQRSYYVQNPDYYPTGLSMSRLTSVAPTMYQIAPNLRTAYVVSEGITAERRISKYGTLALTFTNEYGVHQYLSRNANAPLNGVRPLGSSQNIYQYASEGTSNTRTLFTNYNAQFGSRAGVYANWQLRFRQTDTGGLGNFVSNSYNISADYGRTAFLTRHRVYAGGWLRLPYGFSTFGFLSSHSATRFNITTGQDNNGDSIYNDRPSFATDLTRPSVVQTPLGAFDTAPISGQTIIPVNYGVAPGYVSLQMQAARNFAFGPKLPPPPNAPKPKPGSKPEPPDRMFNLSVGVSAQNILNHVNPSTPVGQLTSPYFGRSLTLNNEQSGSTAANRVLNMFATLNF